MDQRSIDLFLAMKRLSAQAIYNELVAALGLGETPPERERHMIQDRKIMVTIAWNPLGFPLIVALPKGRILNAEYYRDNILAALAQLQPEDDGRKLVVHADLARARIAQKCRTFCEENGLWLAPRPPYSPDLAPQTSFCSVMSKNVSKEWFFHHTRN
jgi:hypothetical protein